MSQSYNEFVIYNVFKRSENNMLRMQITSKTFLGREAWKISEEKWDVIVNKSVTMLFVQFLESLGDA